MYQQTTTEPFASEKFFTDQWYHIATNKRPEKSIVKKVLGYPTACHNVITRYGTPQKLGIPYVNECYVSGEERQDVTKKGYLLADVKQPGLYRMIGMKGEQQGIFNVKFTDYSNYAIASDGKEVFWLLSRTPVICANVLGEAIKKIRDLGFNTKDISVDFNVIKDCTAKK